MVGILSMNPMCANCDCIQERIAIVFDNAFKLNVYVVYVTFMVGMGGGHLVHETDVYKLQLYSIKNCDCIR